MPSPRPFLSKSRLISAWQCPKKAHLEKHRKELGVVTPQMESAFAGGDKVGEIAQKLYGTKQSVEIEFNFRTMVAETRRLIDSSSKDPIFEATFRHENVLVRADVMIPDAEAGGWHVIEVKASTSVKDYHVLDCAIQDWVIRNSGINVLSVSLAHINNQFIYAGNGDYDGLLLENDLTDDARDMEDEVLELVARTREAVSGPEPVVDVGAQCNNPYECQFTGHCWPMDAEYPVTGLGGSKARLAEWVVAGYRDVRDIQLSEITAEQQRRIHRVTTSGNAEILPGARESLEALAYPRYYLDFETISPAIPIWAGTRPYQAVPVQWSCHVETEDGAQSHQEFLDLSGNPPMRALAERLIAALGDSGPVLTYTSYEKTVIKGLAEIFPDLSGSLLKIVNRLWDLYPLVKSNYYHPAMLGSWSIKAVLPALAPHLDYAQLDGIKEGTAASDGFLEAISPGIRPARKAELEDQLLRYCRFDTEAMIEIVRVLSR